jgi:hypothetical protein
MFLQDHAGTGVAAPINAREQRDAALLPHDRRCRRHIVGGNARRLAGGTSKQAAESHAGEKHHQHSYNDRAGAWRSAIDCAQLLLQKFPVLIVKSSFIGSQRSTRRSRRLCAERSALPLAEGPVVSYVFEGSYRTPTQWRFTIDLDQSDPYLRLADVTLSAGNSLCLESMYVNREPRRKFQQQ